MIGILDYIMSLRGHLDMADLMISKGADMNKGLYGACYGGHFEMVDYIISKGANHWNCGLSAACV